MLQIEITDPDGTQRLLQAPDDCVIGKGRDNEVLQGLIHDELAELVWSRLRRRPLVLPVVVQV